MKKPGYLYVAYNPLHKDGIYKIGRTDRTPHERMDELYTTGVPAPFKLLGWRKVKDSAATERTIHDRLGNHRINKNREFFSLSEKQANQVLKSAGGGFLDSVKNGIYNLGLGLVNLLWAIVVVASIGLALGAGVWQILANHDWWIGISIAALSIPLFVVGRWLESKIAANKR